MATVLHPYTLRDAMGGFDPALQELAACAMAAERLFDEMESALAHPGSLREHAVKSIAQDCEMLSERYGALAGSLMGSEGR